MFPLWTSKLIISDVKIESAASNTSPGTRFPVVKAVSDLYMPIGGQIISRNDSLTHNPEKINEDPYGDGWLIKIKLDDNYNADDLLDSNEYETLVNDLHS